MLRNVAALDKMVQAASKTWLNRSSGSVDDLQQCLRLQLCRNAASSSLNGGGCRFSLDLSDIRLNGLDENVPCVVIGGRRGKRRIL